MRIDIQSIPADGQRLTTAYDATLLELETIDRHFTEPITAIIDVVLINEALTVTVTLEALCWVTCGRCLEEKEQSIKKKFQLYYQVTPRDREVDITSDIRDEMALDVPMKTVCSETCKGLCSTCGQNLNKGECNHGIT